MNIRFYALLLSCLATFSTCAKTRDTSEREPRTLHGRSNVPEPVAERAALASDELASMVEWFDYKINYINRMVFHIEQEIEQQHVVFQETCDALHQKGCFDAMVQEGQDAVRQAYSPDLILFFSDPNCMPTLIENFRIQQEGLANLRGQRDSFAQEGVRVYMQRDQLQADIAQMAGGRLSPEGAWAQWQHIWPIFQRDMLTFASSFLNLVESLRDMVPRA